MSKLDYIMSHDYLYVLLDTIKHIKATDKRYSRRCDNGRYFDIEVDIYSVANYSYNYSFDFSCSISDYKAAFEIVRSILFSSVRVKSVVAEWLHCKKPKKLIVG
jgi:hypothetical protein